MSKLDRYSLGNMNPEQKKFRITENLVAYLKRTLNLSFDAQLLEGDQTVVGLLTEVLALGEENQDIVYKILSLPSLTDRFQQAFDLHWNFIEGNSRSIQTVPFSRRVLKIPHFEEQEIELSDPEKLLSQLRAALDLLGITREVTDEQLLTGSEWVLSRLQQFVHVN